MNEKQDILLKHTGLIDRAGRHEFQVMKKHTMLDDCGAKLEGWANTTQLVRYKLNEDGTLRLGDIEMELSAEDAF
jgi:hypothetical protein